MANFLKTKFKKLVTRHTDVPPVNVEPVYPIDNEINIFFDRVIACANRRRCELLAKANEKRREMSARIEKVQQLIDTKALIERTMQNIESQQRILADIESQIAEVRLHQPETRLVFQGDHEQLEQLMLGLGEILEEEMPPAITDYEQLKLTVEVGNEGKNPGELLYPRAVAIDTNTDHIYVADQGTARVSVFTESGEFLTTFTHVLMKEPWGIAIHRDNVYVTDQLIHGVFHFKIHAGIRFIARLTGRGSDDGQFRSPRQLTVLADGDVFIADWCNHRIQILDDALNFERSITHKSMSFPVDVQLTNTEVYVLSDRDSPCLHVFSLDGEKIRSLITRGERMQVYGAWFFCLDAQENIIISDYLADSVKVFSPDGTLIHTIGSLRYPLGVALTKQLKLVVIDSSGEFQLKIYSC